MAAKGSCVSAAFVFVRAFLFNAVVASTFSLVGHYTIRYDAPNSYCRVQKQPIIFHSTFMGTKWPTRLSPRMKHPDAPLLIQMISSDFDVGAKVSFQGKDQATYSGVITGAAYGWWSVQVEDGSIMKKRAKDLTLIASEISVKSKTPKSEVSATEVIYVSAKADTARIERGQQGKAAIAAEGKGSPSEVEKGRLKTAAADQTKPDQLASARKTKTAVQSEGTTSTKSTKKATTTTIRKEAAAAALPSPSTTHMTSPPIAAQAVPAASQAAGTKTTTKRGGTRTVGSKSAASVGATTTPVQNAETPLPPAIATVKPESVPARKSESQNAGTGQAKAKGAVAGSVTGSRSESSTAGLPPTAPAAELPKQPIGLAGMPLRQVPSVTPATSATSAPKQATSGSNVQSEVPPPSSMPQAKSTIEAPKQVIYRTAPAPLIPSDAPPPPSLPKAKSATDAAPPSAEPAPLSAEAVALYGMPLRQAVPPPSSPITDAKSPSQAASASAPAPASLSAEAVALYGMPSREGARPPPSSMAKSPSTEGSSPSQVASVSASTSLSAEAIALYGMPLREVAPPPPSITEPTQSPPDVASASAASASLSAEAVALYSMPPREVAPPPPSPVAEARSPSQAASASVPTSLSAEAVALYGMRLGEVAPPPPSSADQPAQVASEPTPSSSASAALSAEAVALYGMQLREVSPPPPSISSQVADSSLGTVAEWAAAPAAVPAAPPTGNGLAPPPGATQLYGMTLRAVEARSSVDVIVPSATDDDRMESTSEFSEAQPPNPPPVEPEWVLYGMPLREVEEAESGGGFAAELWRKLGDIVRKFGDKYNV